MGLNLEEMVGKRGTIWHKNGVDVVTNATAGHEWFSSTKSNNFDGVRLITPTV
jgi:hypothetical protein